MNKKQESILKIWVLNQSSHAELNMLQRQSGTSKNGRKSKSWVIETGLVFLHQRKSVLLQWEQRQHLVSSMTWWTCTVCWNTTQDTGANVYTHEEMLTAHMYPKVKAFKHLVENYGTTWQDQKQEFATFPLLIGVTNNFIVDPTQ